jgi:hypothetical protein
MTRITWVLAVVIPGVALAPPTWAQAPMPPPPAEYRVILRYRIVAGRNERVPQFFSLVRYLEKLGFHKDPGPDNEPEDYTLDRITGTIPPGGVAELLRHPAIKSMLLLPAGFSLPQDVEQPIKVQLQLTGGLELDRQQALANQVRAKLGQLGFREAIAYDHRGYRRLVGTIPAGNLLTLLKDLRFQPAGWVLPAEPFNDLPSPLKNVAPVLVTEVIPEPEGIAAARDQTPPEPAPGQQKLSPELRERIAMDGARPRRLEIILARPPDSETWREDLLVKAPGIVLEGRLGAVVTAVLPPEQAVALAELDEVSGIRLPPSGAPQLNPVQPFRENNEAVLRGAGLDRLHKLGQVGKGMPLAIVDSDFRGWQTLLGKGLPRNTRLIDLTAERNADLLPDPFPGDPKELGLGTQCALAAAVAAPGCDLFLVRVDPEAPYQLVNVARAINGQPVESIALAQRRSDLESETNQLMQRRVQVLLQRRLALDNFRQDEESRQKRAAYFQMQAEFDKEEQAFQDKMGRYLQLVDDLKRLSEVRAVASSLVWNVGHPADGSAPLTRYLDDNPFRGAFWFQSAGNTRGQVWAGLFRDRDRNGVMEFAPFGEPLPARRWSPELNFLAWQRFDGGQTAELPAMARVRLTLQWREPHSPEFFRDPGDPYRQPLAQLRLVVLRQRDPTGTRLPADEMEVVAASVGLPQRILNLPNAATYEQSVEFTVDPPGQYALRLLGSVPGSVRPRGAAALAGRSEEQPGGELRPRIFVEVRDDSSRGAGRPIFIDFATAEGGIGMPGDAYHTITVGSASADRFAEPYSALGPPWNLRLLAKPTVLSYGRLHLDKEGPKDPTGAAAAFAAGLTTSAFSAGMPRAWFWRNITNQPGHTLWVPEGWR